MKMNELPCHVDILFKIQAAAELLWLLCGRELSPACCTDHMTIPHLPSL
jgi:hypothetical protein